MPGRHRRPSRAGARASQRPPGLHGGPAARPGPRRGRAALRSRDPRRHEQGRGRQALGARDDDGRAPRDAGAHGAVVDAVKLRYRSAPPPAAAARCGGPTDRAARRAGARRGARPGRRAHERRACRRARDDRPLARLGGPMTTDEIRETFLRFFAERDHERLPSAPLVPATYDPSVLLTTAGMHPFKPYFQGVERPPHQRLTSCPEVLPHHRYRERRQHPPPPDVLRDARQLLDRRLLQAGRRRVRLGAVPQGFGFKAEDIWITVFEGDEELGIGPDEEAIAAWVSVGVPRERIVLCPRSENFWQAGPTGPCGPCWELYLDRGVDFGKPDDLPGGENERFLEYWNLVFMQFDQEPRRRRSRRCPRKHRHGPGAQPDGRDQAGRRVDLRHRSFRPLIELGEELAGAYGARRARAAHPRRPQPRDGVPVADGVVPSNEDRGYILRRLMRRAIQQGRALGIEPGFLPKFGARVIELMGDSYPELPESGPRSPLADERGGGLRAHAGAGHAAAGGADRARQGTRRRGHLQRGRLPPSRHIRLPDRPDARAGGGTGAGGRRGRLRAPDGRAARARSRWRGQGGRGGRRRCARPGARVRGRDRVRDGVHRLRARRAGDRGRRGRA